MTFTLSTTTDQTGGIYSNGPSTLGEFSTMKQAFAGIKENLIPGSRGTGCFAITDHAGSVWEADPRGPIEDIAGLVRISEDGEIIEEWQP